MTQALVLALPNFNEIETDASGYGISAIMQQKGHLIAFLSRTLAPKHQSLSAYEKELLVVVLALQKITTPFQSKWLPKLLGFDYEIEYKKGKENVVADALSRVQRQGELFSLLSEVTTNEFMEVVTKLWTTDLVLSKVIQGLKEGTAGNSKYTWHNQQLRRKGKWVVGADTEIRLALVKHFHNSAVRGHSGVPTTTKRLGSFFYWKGMRRMVKELVRTFDVCQRNKANLSSYPGLLQPLPILTQIWHDISMDFIDALPVSQGKTKIIAQLFLDYIYKLHGLPKSIVSDRDKVFMSLFWKSLFKMLQVQLKMFLVLGWHLEEIHVTWAHLEKKRTRLQTYTKSLDELCIERVETTS
ncbi:transposon ty3-G gag-pol polyprotein [Tanacetum coccineum]